MLGVTRYGGWTLRIIQFDINTATCLRPQNVPKLSELATFHSKSQYLGGLYFKYTGILCFETFKYQLVDSSQFQC